MVAIHRILAATDFSPAGRSAVARAGQLAAQHRAELLVIHATPDWNLFSNRLPVRQQHYEGITRNADAVISHETAWLLAAFGVHARGEVHRGRASHTILRAVEAHDPSLLVIGARGEHAAQMAPAALGGTTLKLISQVAVPVLLTRDHKLGAYSVSLAAVNGSHEHARRIVSWSTLLVNTGSCHVVRAFEVPYVERLRLCRTVSAEIDACADDARKSAAEATQSLLSAATGSARMHAHVVQGMPLPAILSEIARYGPQFIAVGKHEREPHEVAHPMMGCVGVRLAYHSPTDVLIVP